MIKQPLICFIMLFFFTASVAQVNDAIPVVTTGDTTFSAPREFSIPPSPLFDLMGTLPSMVAKTSEIKDFKVDWNFKTWKVSPNLAIQGQPVWELFYNRKNLSKYRRASGFARSLASMDISIGTIQNDVGDRRIGGAIRLNVYRKNDPLLLEKVYDDIEESYAAELDSLRKQERQLLKALDTVTSAAEQQALRVQLRENDWQISSIYPRRTAAIRDRAAGFIRDNWNASYIDVAFGKVNTYTTDSTGSLKKLSLTKNTGTGFWLNGGIGIGKRGFVSGLVRFTFYRETLDFLQTDDLTGDTATQYTTLANSLLTAGVNFRYGGPLFNFFAEFVHERNDFAVSDKKVMNAMIQQDATLIPNTLRRELITPYSINFGGDWRASRNLIINFGVRCLMNNHFQTTAFIPIANISCMMR